MSRIYDFEEQMKEVMDEYYLEQSTEVDILLRRLEVLQYENMQLKQEIEKIKGDK